MANYFHGVQLVAISIEERNVKLLEILARELKVWPEGNNFASQDCDKEIRFDKDDGDDFYVETLAEDAGVGYGNGVKISKAEWQAAVAELASPIKSLEDRIKERAIAALAEFEAIVPGSDVWKRISCIYAAMVPAKAPAALPGVVQLPGGMDGAVYVTVRSDVPVARYDAQFEDWFSRSGWTHSTSKGAAWDAWQASRALVVVELPDSSETVGEWSLEAYRLARDEFVDAIEAAGLKVAK